MKIPLHFWVVNRMNTKKAFFNQKNTVENLTKVDKDASHHYLEAIDVFSKTTYQSIYVIDYHDQKFEYVSNSPIFLCGNTVDDVMDLGYEFYTKNVKKSDLDLLIKINDVGFQFYEKLPLEDRKLYTIHYDFHLLNEHKKEILVNHKLTPLFLNEEGKIWKALCIVSLSTNQNAGNIYIQKQNDNTIWNFDLEREVWFKTEKIKLTEREKEILQLYSRSFNMNEIADKLFITQDTVKYHRKKLFEKMDVTNITEALSYAINFKLI